MRELLSQVLEQQNKANILIRSLEKSITKLKKQKVKVILPEQLTQLATFYKALQDKLKKAELGWAEICLHISMLKDN